MYRSHFHSDEVPQDVQVRVPAGQEVRCPCFNPEKPRRVDGVVVGKGDICNRLLFKGEASDKPQQFKCFACGNTVTICKG